MSFVSVSTPFNISLEFPTAKTSRRIFAWGIDIAIMIAYGAIMFGFVVDERYGSDVFYDTNTAYLLIVSFPLYFYHLIQEVFFKGQSIGKKVMKLQVISIHGGFAEINQYIMRWLFRIWELPIIFGVLVPSAFIILIYLVITCVLGIVAFILVVSTNKNQRLGDIVAGTTVIEKSERIYLEETVFKTIVDVDNYKVQFPQVMNLNDRDINAINNVLNMRHKNGNMDVVNRVANKVKDVLEIKTDMYNLDFLEKLIADYSYLATKE